MENEILLRMNEDGVFEEYKEPFATIDCPTEEDYRHLEEAVRYKEAHRWIPVTERLPEKMEPVLAWTVYDGFSESACWTGHGWETTWTSDIFYGVTHWMPLPEPPMEEA